jgi:hypothetical protein
MDGFLGDATDLLHRTPRVVRALLHGVPDTWTGTAPTAVHG